MRTFIKYYPLFFPFCFLLAYFIYLPGFSAGFIFDDDINLSKFKDIRVGFQGLWQFFKETERPLSFLSFMLNDNAWPSTPDSFILTNVLLHFLCCCLLMLCLILVGKNLAWSKSKRELIALYASFAWLVHPLFVSTTLYVIQRMTILSAIFVLLSLISYLHGRLQLANKNNKAWFWLLFAVPAFGYLGLLCKENAALVPIFLLVFETTLFRNKLGTNYFYQLWKKIYIYIPIIIMVASIFIFIDKWLITYHLREFTLVERLLTQSTVLIYYLSLLILPKTSTNGLHYENYPVSTSLFEPWVTFPSVMLILGLVLFFFLYRKKYPFLSFGVLFFFAGHLMESSFLALELYFEHRNYLPTMMLFFALSVGLFRIYEKHKQFAVCLSMVILIVLSGSTYARASLWGNQLLILGVWTENNPQSYRNYIEGHIRGHKLKRYDLAIDFLEKGIRRLPENVHLQIGYVGYSCGSGTLKENDIDRLKSLLRTTKSTSKDHLYKNLNHLLEHSFSTRCNFLTFDVVRAILETTLENPNIIMFNIRMHEMLHLLGRLELEAKNFEKAKNLFFESFHYHPNPNAALQQIALLAAFEQYQFAYNYLIDTRKIISGNLSEEERREANRWNDFSYMESILLKELNIFSK